MATRYIDPNSTAGGNGTTNALAGANRAYASFAEWESARQGDLTVRAEVEEAIFSSNGGAADTAHANGIDGWTTSNLYYIDVKVDPASRHAGMWSTTKYRREANGGAGAPLLITEDYTRVDGFQVNLHSFNAGIVSIGGQHVRVSNCILKATGVSATAIGTGPVVNAYYVYNCLAYDCTTGINLGTTVAGYVYNNTVHSCGTGIAGHFSRVARVKNNLVQDCVTACYSSDFHADSTNNCSDDGTQPGTNGQNGEVTFVDEANDNFHLASSDTVAGGNGADLSADAAFPFATDIDGEARAAPWDIGADERAITAVTGTGAVTGAAPTVTGIATLAMTAAGAVVAAPSTVSGAATLAISASAAVVSAVPTVTGTATLALSGTGAVVAPTPTIDGTGTIDNPDITEWVFSESDRIIAVANEGRILAVENEGRIVALENEGRIIAIDDREGNE